MSKLSNYIIEFLKEYQNHVGVFEFDVEELSEVELVALYSGIIYNLSKREKSCKIIR